MKGENLNRQHEILHHLNCIPKKILSIHGREDITEFVLRELCHKSCFNFKKAAYFVQNPDFNCLKGVAGYFHNETPTVCDLLWEHPDKFVDRLHGADFNTKVRKLNQQDLKFKNNQEECLQNISEQLSIQNPSHRLVKMKHGNNGILVFEKENKDEPIITDYLDNGISLLGFCPIY